MKANSEIDFVISEEDMEELKRIVQIKGYGDSSFFPVFGREIKKLFYPKQELDSALTIIGRI